MIELVLPLIVAGAAAVAGTFAVTRVVDRLTVKLLTILGAPQVGKTTLFRLLSDGSVAASPEPTSGPAAGDTIRVTVGARQPKFRLLQDLPGTDGLGYPVWRKAFGSADHVWYLFRADRLASGDPVEVARVTDHLERMNNWMASKRGKPNVLLIGTWADSAPGFREDAATFIRSIEAAPAGRVAAAKLNNAAIVVGGLNSKVNGDRLVRSIGERLVGKV